MTTVGVVIVSIILLSLGVAGLIGDAYWFLWWKSSGATETTCGANYQYCTPTGETTESGASYYTYNLAWWWIILAIVGSVFTAIGAIGLSRMKVLKKEV